MSTRANIRLTDACDKIWFYKHSDGYPSGVEKLLIKFGKWVKEGKIRDNVQQAGGWLIVLGIEDLSRILGKDAKCLPEPEGKKDCFGWKVGSIEPTTGQHGDIEYLYLIDLEEKTITCSTPTGLTLFTVPFGKKFPSKFTRDY